MKRIAFALILLPLITWAGPGTGTFEEGGLRWIRDHGPEPYRMHLTKTGGNDPRPDLWALARGHCSWRAKIDAPGYHPGWIEDYLESLWRALDGNGKEKRKKWKHLRHYKLDRYDSDHGKLRGLKTRVEVGSDWDDSDWPDFLRSKRSNFTYTDNAFVSSKTDGAQRWAAMRVKLRDAMNAENYVHYAYWDGIQQFDLDTFHSAKIGKTGKWNDNGVWRHKVRIKTCAGWWDQTYELDTLRTRVTDFDKAIHQGIDAVFKRGPACAAKGGWDATYIDKHSGGYLHVTHRCNGKRSDGHFARAERRFTMEESRRFVDLLAKSVDHY